MRCLASSHPWSALACVASKSRLVQVKPSPIGVSSTCILASARNSPKGALACLKNCTPPTRLHRPSVQEMLGDDALQQCVIYMVIPRPVGVDDQDRTPSAHSETAAQRTLDALRVPERGQPVDARQGPEVSCQALRGLWRGAVAVFADQD